MQTFDFRYEVLEDQHFTV